MASALIRSEGGASLRITASSASPFISLPRASCGPRADSTAMRTFALLAARARPKAAINSASAKPGGPTATLRMVGLDECTHAADATAVVTATANIKLIQRQALLTKPQ